MNHVFFEDITKIGPDLLEISKDIVVSEMLMCFMGAVSTVFHLFEKERGRDIILPLSLLDVILYNGRKLSKRV